jgi:hypothetical protein
MEEPVLLLWSDELILLCKWKKKRNNKSQSGISNHVEQKPKNDHKSSRPSGRERDEGPARVKQNTKDDNNNNNIKGPDKNEKGFQISLYII